MARGYPDYFNNSVFAAPGGVLAARVDGLVAPTGVTTVLFNIETRGVLSSCEIRGDQIALYMSIAFHIIVDGVILQATTLPDLLYRNYNGLDGNFLGITEFSLDADNWRIFIKPEISWGQSFSVDIEHACGVNVNVMYHYIYRWIV